MGFLSKLLDMPSFNGATNALLVELALLEFTESQRTHLKGRVIELYRTHRASTGASRCRRCVASSRTSARRSKRWCFPSWGWRRLRPARPRRRAREGAGQAAAVGREPDRGGEVEARLDKLKSVAGRERPRRGW